MISVFKLQDIITGTTAVTAGVRAHHTTNLRLVRKTTNIEIGIVFQTVSIRSFCSRSKSR